MPSLPLSYIATWAIAAATIGGVIARPWRLPEAIWAVLGAACLVVFSLISWAHALAAIMRGMDVYLFLAGMMILAELAREEGVFNWLATHAARHANGSAKRLFTLVYAVGTLVTVFLSNDATAVVLTPAVYAVAKATKVEPLPYLFICAFVANAASFALPISNPANLVVFGRHMPVLSTWLAQFGIPSIFAIVTTYVALRLLHTKALHQPISRGVEIVEFTRAGRLSACGIIVAAAVIVSVSALGLRLGLPTFIAGAATAVIVLSSERRSPADLFRHVSWSVLPLVAGLFVLVEGLIDTGVIDRLAFALHALAEGSAVTASMTVGILTAIACNLMNNLSAGLIAGSAAASIPLPAHVTGALLIGVDLGPNLSVTGSLATILWLAALRREGEHVSAWHFLRVGAVVTIPALVISLLGVTF